MTRDPKITPTAVKAPHGATTTEITWADGHRSVYANEQLRGYCPCAHCQGHGGTIELVPGSNSELRDIGQYHFVGLSPKRNSEGSETGRNECRVPRFPPPGGGLVLPNGSKR